MGAAAAAAAAAAEECPHDSPMLGVQILPVKDLNESSLKVEPKL